jgi:Ion transport protein
MWKTLVDIASFTVVLFLFMFVYTILGMEVFAEKAKFSPDDKVDMEDGESIPQNFDSFLWAFTTVFVLLTEDGWSAVFYAYYRAVGATRANLYFISLFIIGPRILLNLFLAILL